MTGKTRILVVEHKAPLGMEMAFLLRRAGREVQVANAGQKGMALALENPFDLVVLEVDLPDVSGFEVCRQLKQAPASRTTPVVLVSARSGEPDIQQGLELGAVDYIVTPFEATDFIFRIISQVKVRTPFVTALSENETTPCLESRAVV
jgi:DNA-binding response OmpR family regulator